MDENGPVSPLDSILEEMFIEEEGNLTPPEDLSHEEAERWIESVITFKNNAEAAIKVVANLAAKNPKLFESLSKGHRDKVIHDIASALSGGKDLLDMNAEDALHLLDMKIEDLRSIIRTKIVLNDCKVKLSKEEFEESLRLAKVMSVDKS